MSGIIQIKRLPKSNKDVDFEKCILCQSVKKEALSFSEQGKQNLIVAAEKLKDDNLLNILKTKSGYKYHTRSCYSKMTLKGGRVKEKNSCIENQETAETPSTSTSPGNIVFAQRPKRRKISSEKNINKTCIICNCVQQNQDRTLFRICTNSRARLFRKAYNLNADAVFSRCAIYRNEGDIFAADIMYHNNCMAKYILQYQRKVDLLLTHVEEDDQQLISGDIYEQALKILLEQLNFNENSYSLSYCRDVLNKQLGVDYTINNRQMKTMLINHFETSISFMYPSSKRHSQMCYLTSVGPKDCIELLRTSNAIKECAESLRLECSSYDFQLESSYCNARDTFLSMNNYSMNVPKAFKHFFEYFFGKKRMSSQSMQLQSSVVFQILCFILNHKKTPLHVAFAQAIHTICKSRKLIGLFNKFGLCICYGSLCRLDTGLAKRAINMSEASSHLIPLPSTILNKIPINAAIDNFDHEESTKSGKKGSHDTVMIITQNIPKCTTIINQNVISSIPHDTNSRERKLPCNLECQKLWSVGYLKKGYSLPDSFGTTSNAGNQQLESNTRNDFFLWCLSRHKARSMSPNTFDFHTFIRS